MSPKDLEKNELYCVVPTNNYPRERILSKGGLVFHLLMDNL